MEIAPHRGGGKTYAALEQILSAILAGKDAQFISPYRGRCIWMAKLIVTRCSVRPEYKITQDKTTEMFILFVKGFPNVKPKSS